MMTASNLLHSSGHRSVGFVALGLILLTSGCSTSSENREDNFDRSELFTDIISQTDLDALSDVSGLEGSATYTGVAAANFGAFSGTSDATITADFDTNAISGSMTSWTDTDPDYELRGQVLLSNGTISDDGSFASVMAGNIERRNLGSGGVIVDDVFVLDDAVDLIVFGGAAEGQIYDSIDGAAASNLIGEFNGLIVGGGDVIGGFVATE
jgi:hypothetical protein